ncbi:hypothetical protein EMIHUDRAFT_437460 [Emiliania huxleyi CCMP1516]|uniref:SGNH domain-containing protein n=2 Tax=Emiliania huxleyi TaxID=2903 RepID=A0A0D3IKK9_EMIH1|nr:hypothetical protein EMIHUDRAFT_437460 [Emiliania huxleyi CCMP1516]EOD11794.1 hypothetical protein EMIHUDRAFT_437460 [Emiliania huxleyi CCMP1516]|eukprot:XP_005764223.1 hypothetical protein EMIHUDRAFT_437460 [Emiliania huxleyi CCMP1516]
MTMLAVVVFLVTALPSADPPTSFSYPSCPELAGSTGLVPYRARQCSGATAGDGGELSEEETTIVDRAERRALDLCASRPTGTCSSIPDVIATLRKKTRTRCVKSPAIVFIGDSVTVQSWNAAQCSLRQAGLKRCPDSTFRNESALGYVMKHHGWNALKEHLQHSALVTSNDSADTAIRKLLKQSGQQAIVQSYQDDAQYVKEARFTSSTSCAADTANVVRVLLVWRAGGRRRGPGLVASRDAPKEARAVFKDLMLKNVGSCAVTVYNEGLHHRSDFSNRTIFADSVRHVLRTLDQLAQPSGPFAMAREISTQHFAGTTDGSGRFDRRAPAGQHKKADQQILPPSCEVIHGGAANTGEYNTILKREVALTRNVRFVPYAAATHAWGVGKSGDCTHFSCYSPLQYAPIWDGVVDGMQGWFDER